MGLFAPMQQNPVMHGEPAPRRSKQEEGATIGALLFLRTVLPTDFKTPWPLRQPPFSGLVRQAPFPRIRFALRCGRQHRVLHALRHRGARHIHLVPIKRICRLCDRVICERRLLFLLILHTLFLPSARGFAPGAYITCSICRKKSAIQVNIFLKMPYFALLLQANFDKIEAV